MGFGSAGGFWRKRGDNFRYLHDEISDGFVAFSQIQAKSSYSNQDIVQVASTSGYPLTNSQLDLSAISADYPTSQTLRYYNQLNFSNALSGATGSGQWTGTNCSKGLVVSTNTEVNPNTTPQTVILVCSGLDEDLGDTYVLASRVGLVATGKLGLLYLSNQLAFQLNASTFARIAFNGTRTSGTKLIIGTYDGSKTRAGLNLYINDMTTPLTVDAVAGTAGDVGNDTFATTTHNSNDTLKMEMNWFNKELNLSERIAAKEILEQRYTFS